MTPPTPRDVDEVAVERACLGDRTVHLNRAEVAAAFQQMNARGYPAYVIAERLDVTPRTVWRWRAGLTALPFPRRSRTPGEQAC